MIMYYIFPFFIALFIDLEQFYYKIFLIYKKILLTISLKIRHNESIVTKGSASRPAVFWQGQCQFIKITVPKGETLCQNYL